MSNTPLHSKLLELDRKGLKRFMMPGHKGKAPYGIDDLFAIDFTEHFETGHLYDGRDPILSAEKEYAKYFESKSCFFLTGGSSMGIIASLSAVCGINSKVIVDRNCHKSVLNAISILNLQPKFIAPDILHPFDIPCSIPLKSLEDIIEQNRDAAAVFITSPNYFGIKQDIKSIANICHNYNIPLIVDEAHGAHLPAVNLNCAVKDGADIGISSGHKTMPILTQGAFITSNGLIRDEDIRYHMSIYGTTSPSYAIMSSMDIARDYLETDGFSKYLNIAKTVSKLRTFIDETTAFKTLRTSIIRDIDPTRLVIFCGNTDITGDTLAKELYLDHNIAVEFYNNKNVVLIVTSSDSDLDIQHLSYSLSKIRVNKVWDYVDNPPKILPYSMHIPDAVMPVRHAMFSKKQYISIENAEGHVCAEAIVPYPPGVPLIYPGEQIDRSVIEFLKDMCYNTIKIVCE